MNLYDLKKGDYFILKEDPYLPPYHPAIDAKDQYRFDHVDGMYSFCLDKDNKPVHFAAWTDVERV